MTADLFGRVLRDRGLAEGMVREHRFARQLGREWRFDFAWPDRKLALEFEGLVFYGAGGRHQRAVGYEADLEKYNTALLLDWKVLRVSQNQAADGTALMWLRIMLGGE